MVVCYYYDIIRNYNIMDRECEYPLREARWIFPFNWPCPQLNRTIPVKGNIY